MKASELLIGIVGVFAVISAILTTIYIFSKIILFLIRMDLPLYRKLKHRFYYKHINFRDVGYVLSRMLLFMFGLIAFTYIAVISIHYIGHIDIQDYSKNQNAKFIESIKIGIFAIMIPILMKITKDFIVYSIVSTRVIYRYIIQHKYPSRSDVQFYKQVDELLNPMIIQIEKGQHIDVKTLRSNKINTINNTIDQLIKEGRTVVLNREAINDITLISVRVDNQCLLDILEMAYVKSYGQPVMSIYPQFKHPSWIIKIFNLNGFGEHQQSKAFNYFPIKTVI